MATSRSKTTENKSTTWLAQCRMGPSAPLDQRKHMRPPIETAAWPRRRTSSRRTASSRPRDVTAQAIQTPSRSQRCNVAESVDARFEGTATEFVTAELASPRFTDGAVVTTPAEDSGVRVVLNAPRRNTCCDKSCRRFPSTRCRSDATIPSPSSQWPQLLRAQRPVRGAGGRHKCGTRPCRCLWSSLAAAAAAAACEVTRTNMFCATAGPLEGSPSIARPTLQDNGIDPWYDAAERSSQSTA
mmetsp:Transcript_81708/g.227506  ORF Transcript_81708/g.227506 Transcript_81708/m.227506 type:complete len:242 (+) Transcript_81708:1256-1981(+)